MGGEEVCGGSVCGRARKKIFFLDLLRLLLTQSETKFPAIILMTQTLTSKKFSKCLKRKIVEFRYRHYTDSSLL